MIIFNRKFWAGCLMLATGIQAGLADILTLREAFERADKANFNYLLAAESIEIAEASKTRSRSALLPQVNLFAGQGRSMVPSMTDGSRAYLDRFDAVLRASISLVNFESVDNYRIARIGLEETRQQLDETVQAILEGIGQAYLTHWRNERRLDVIDANLSRDTTLLDIARSQKDAGVATSLDVTRAEVRLATNELARLQQETLVLGSGLTLLRALNLPLNMTPELERSLIPENIMEPEYSNNLLAQAMQNRPDFKALQSRLTISEIALGQAKRERLPDLTLSGEWGYTSESYSDDMEEQWSVQLGLSVPIFEGFRISSQNRQARAQLNQAEIALADLEAQIEAELRFAIQELRSRFNQIKVARKQANLGEKEFELARSRFQEGVADNSDVVDAQATLADAEDGLVEAEYQFLLSRIALARTAGDVRLIFQPIILR